MSSQLTGKLLRSNRDGMAEGPRERLRRIETQGALRRIFDLSPREQLDVYLELGKYLGADLDGENHIPDLLAQGALPQPVATLSGGTLAWRAEDIRRLRETGTVAPHTYCELRERLLDSQQLADELGITVGYLRNALRRKARTVPQPVGRVGMANYWTRSGVDAWKQGRAKRSSR